MRPTICALLLLVLALAPRPALPAAAPPQEDSRLQGFRVVAREDQRRLVALTLAVRGRAEVRGDEDAAPPLARAVRDRVLADARREAALRAEKRLERLIARGAMDLVFRFPGGKAADAVFVQQWQDLPPPAPGVAAARVRAEVLFVLAPTASGEELYAVHSMQSAAGPGNRTRFDAGADALSRALERAVLEELEAAENDALEMGR
jgi:hypothetical protein